jgi:hypothetical protein
MVSGERLFALGAILIGTLNVALAIWLIFSF